ncbi:MAG: BREX system ATP-binding domain-containing protein [Mesotoga sp.]
MDYHPMFEAIRAGAAVPVDYIKEILTGRDKYQVEIENDIDYILTGRSKVRVFLGQYGLGKTTLARYAEYLAREKGMMISSLAEKDYDTLHKQDEFFRSVMKNMSLVGISGNPLKIFLGAWAERIIEELKDQEIPAEEIMPVKEYLSKRDHYDPGGMFSQFCAAYVVSTAKGETTEEFYAYLVGDSVDKRSMKKRGIYHFLQDDGWNFLRSFTSLMDTLQVPGMVVIMDELESIMNRRRDVRERTFNQLREIIDRLSAGFLQRTYFLWLGTDVWFENKNRGIASYHALYDRMKNITGDDSGKSLILSLKPLELDGFKMLARKLIKLYRECYSFDGGKEIEELLAKSLKQQYTGVDGKIRPTTREMTKLTVEFLDSMRQGRKPESSDKKPVKAVDELW